MTSEAKATVKREWKLELESEYRFELDPGTTLAIKLIEGHAEIFGFELVEGKSYIFGYECKAAVYTWHGCTIEISQPSTEYVSDETPMSAYANLHIAFEQMRVRALRKLHGSPPHPDEPDTPVEPPRVLVLGPENSGKTTVCKILTNYAVRAGQGWSPIYVNVDPSEGGWAAPGIVSSAPITGPISTYSPANPLGSAATTTPMSFTSNALLPLAYWYGHADIRKNPLLLERLVRNLGENTKDRFDNDPESRVSGLIIDTPSSFASGQGSNDPRHRLIKACIEAFNVNVIIVVGHEKLNVEMQRAYSSQLTIVKIPKSGGVVELDYAYRERVHRYQLHAYMYGQIIPAPAGVTNATIGGESFTDLALAPSSTVINFGDLSIYRIGAGIQLLPSPAVHGAVLINNYTESMAPTSALPIGAKRVVSEMQPAVIDPAQPGSGLLNAVLALLVPLNPDENERYDEELLDLTISGFLVVTHLDIPRKKMTILSPNQGSIVGRTAVLGSFEWQEQ